MIEQQRAQRGAPALRPRQPDVDEQLACDLHALDRVAAGQQALGRAAAQIELLDLTRLSGARRVEEREAGVAQVSRVGECIGARDEEPAPSRVIVRAEPQRHREPLRGALERERLGGASGGKLRTVGRETSLARPFPMVRESLRWRTACLERGREHAVELAALRHRQPADERLAHAIVIRLDDLVAGADQPCRAQLLDRRRGIVGFECRRDGRHHARQRGGVGDDDVQQAPGCWRQIARACPQRIIERVGARTALGGEPTELGDEHRVALRLARDRVRVDPLIRRNRAGELDRVRGLEPGECDLLDVRQPAHQRGLLGTPRGHDEQERWRRPREQIREQRAGVGIRPLRVVDQERE